MGFLRRELSVNSRTVVIMSTFLRKEEFCLHQKNISLNSITQKCLKAEVTQHLAAKQGVLLQLTGADISAAIYVQLKQIML